jgi:hypothetical protein
MLAVMSSCRSSRAPSHFSVVVIGNAFHRLPRDLVAGRVHGWLQPGRYLALCWSSGAQAGPLDWQVAFGGLLRRWKEALGGGDRVPPSTIRFRPSSARTRATPASPRRSASRASWQ